jgi:hypothetical protein
MNNYEQYAVIVQQINALTAKKDEIKVKILGDMVEQGEDKVQTEVGSFTVAHLKTWEYPKKVLELGEKFKSAKAKAESTGEAKFVETPSLRFTGIKL